MLKLLHTSDWHLGWATRAAAREQQATDEAALKLEEAPTFGTPGISERRTAFEELRELACCVWLDKPAIPNPRSGIFFHHPGCQIMNEGA